MLNDDPVRYGYAYYHGIEIASILPFLIAFTLKDFSGDTIPKRMMALLAILQIAVTLLFFAESDHKPAETNKTNPFLLSFYESPAYLNGDLRKIVREMDDTSAVVGSGRIIAHLADRQKIYYFPKLQDANQLLVLRRTDFFPSYKAQLDSVTKELINSGLWKVQYSDADVLYLKKIAR